MKSWPSNPGVMLDDMDFFKNYYVLYERENGLPQIRVTDLRNCAVDAVLSFPNLPTPPIPTSTGNTTPAEFRYGVRVARHPALGV